MSKKTQPDAKSERAIFSLPRPLVTKLGKYAELCRGGNKSRFVADALEAYIDSLRRHRHTARLRASYAASARHGEALAADWRHLDDEAWAKIDELEASSKE